MTFVVRDTKAGEVPREKQWSVNPPCPTRPRCSPVRVFTAQRREVRQQTQLPSPDRHGPAGAFQHQIRSGGRIPLKKISLWMKSHIPFAAVSWAPVPRYPEDAGQLGALLTDLQGICLVLATPAKPFWIPKPCLSRWDTSWVSCPVSSPTPRVLYQNPARYSSREQAGAREYFCSSGRTWVLVKSSYGDILPWETTWFKR